MAELLAIIHVAPGALKPNPWNSNVVGPEMETRLEESLRRFGVYKPIVCRELADGTLEILGGEHRARAAGRLGMETVPVVNLGTISDAKAKQIGLADNGRYGEDDALKLAAILKEFGQEDIASFLPYTEQDLAGIFAAERIDLDDLDLDDGDGKGDTGLEELMSTRATVTHALMRFKVPLEDQKTVEALVARVMKTRGYDKEEDSLIAAGMALVDIARAAAEVV